MIGVAATAQVTPCKTVRREMLVDHVFWLSAMCMIPLNQRFKPGWISPVICLRWRCVGVVDPSQRECARRWRGAVL